MAENVEQNKDQQIAELKEQVASLKVRGLRTYEENSMLKASPQVAMMKAKMDYDLAMATQFVKSGAFPKMSAEQVYTIMKAGEEMGLRPIEALNGLYIVNGSINPYGKFMVAKIKGNGWKIEYLNETTDRVTIRVSKGDEAFEETVVANDPILMKSNAFKFARFSKLRYHGLRRIVSFHLAHLFGGITDPETAEYYDQSFDDHGNTAILTNPELMQLINEAKDLDELEEIARENVQIKKDINLLSALGAAKKRHEQ